MPTPSNVYTLWFGLQTAKGTPATAPQWGTRVTGADIAPTPERDRIEETNATRDGGDRYTVRIEVTGGGEFVLRPTIAGIVLYGILGAKSVTGASPYVHEQTPADDQPWLTVWRSLGNTLFERFDDCKITSATISGEGGQNLACSTTIMGLKPTRLTSIPAGGTIDTAFPFRVPGTVYTVEGAVLHTIRSFSLTINADQNPIQTDEIYNTFLEPGLRTIELSYTEVFQDLSRYNKTLYGGAAGTDPSEELYHGIWNAIFPGGGGSSLEIDIPNLAYMAAPLAPDPGGDPLQMEVAGEADSPGAGGDIITTTVSNETATYAAV